ncbi:hypothetical protein [Amycolatopsis sp. CA-230715]|uniref:hypothetical protein n=1 Tax=Amycolatopsis sp. CA-230715 TaxID=2745196 RepID=UPI001C00B64E|nr:hypothetical protein [Amycolatopsis sp. CA-230715]QWF80940.1 hypothetical protein HUW46_04365 [Amycolatopsis sp. CA-230715]
MTGTKTARWAELRPGQVWVTADGSTRVVDRVTRAVWRTTGRRQNVIMFDGHGPETHPDTFEVTVVPDRS